MDEIKLRYVMVDREAIRKGGKEEYKFFYFTLEEIEVHGDKWLGMCKFMHENRPSHDWDFVVGSPDLFTGMRDREGKELYKNDLVKEGNKLLRIIWSSLTNGWWFANKKKEHAKKINLQNIKLFGNAYENWDMIKPDEPVKSV